MRHKCSQHGLKKWFQIQIFYNGVDSNIKSNIDETTKGSLMHHTYKRAFQIISDMAMNLYMCPNERFKYKLKPPTMKVINAEDKYQQILEKLNWLGTTIKLMRVEPYVENQLDHVSYIGNKGGNPCSKTYNSCWKDHPNLSREVIK